MKSAKSVAVDAPSHRRSQPSRQARTNPSRRPANAARAGESSNAANDSRSLGAQPVEILPAITHFADGMSALPKELVRHFTLLKEVDAKIFAPEEQLFKLVAETAKLPAPNTTQSVASNQAHSFPAGDDAAASAAPTIDVFDPSNIPRRQLFRQTAVKIQEMLVSLEEKNHVLCTANEALQRQLARAEDVWPYLENEFSDEAKWGSNTHWAYPENRSSGKVSQTERMRRDGAAAISAAAQALAEEAAARSDARKQAVQARKNLKTQHHDSDADDLEKRPKEVPKKGGKSRKSAAAAAADTSNVNAGVTGSTSNGSHPPKRRKVEKTANGDKVTSAAATNNIINTATAAPTSTPAAAAAARASAASTTAITTGAVTAGTAVGSSGLASGSNVSRPKLSSAKETPALDGPKKRKALPTGSGQAKKKTPSTTTSPVIGTNLDSKVPARASPAPGSAPAPRSGPVRARKNSVQSNTDATKGRPPTSAPVHNSNGHGSGADTPEQASTAPFPKPGSDVKPSKEAVAPSKTMETIKGEAHNPQSAPSPTNMTIATTTTMTTTTTMPSTFSKRNSIPEEVDQEIETAPRSVPIPVPKKSGRASKPSTPALATFQEAAASRSRPSRAAEGNSGNNSSNNNTSNNNSHSHSNSNSSNNRKSHKKSSSAAQQSLIQQVHATDVNNSVQVEDEEGEIDADEPTYCYCNSVSYGEMVACDADGCEREWFHLACVGLKVAPGSKTKWYCEDCKDRLKMSSKKAGRDSSAVFPDLQTQPSSDLKTKRTRYSEHSSWMPLPSMYQYEMDWASGSV
ncbi:hypothetical protein E4U46_006955 [Claviceps purpurea]|nr:hypothetical protein E4U46_006955 [Claviceps purpurea]